MVQDRIIQLDSLRRELDSRAAPSEEYVPLGKEGLALMKEESGLRHALEDAGAPAPTTADHAREKLAAICSRRGELANFDAETKVSDHYDIEEERGLSAYLEGLDAAEDGPTGEEPPAGNGEPTMLAAQEDEEVGFSTLGKCSYAGGSGALSWRARRAEAIHTEDGQRRDPCL